MHVMWCESWSMSDCKKEDNLPWLQIMTSLGNLIGTLAHTELTQRHIFLSQQKLLSYDDLTLVGEKFLSAK